MTDELTIEALAEKHHPQLLLRALELARKRRSFSQDLDEYEDCISVPWPLPSEAETRAWKRGGSEKFNATGAYAHRTKCPHGGALHFFRWYFRPVEELGAAIRQQWADEDAGVL